MDTANSALAAYRARALELIDALRAHVDDHFEVDPETSDWGHAGTAQHIVALLRDTCEFAGIEEVCPYHERDCAD